MRLQRAPEQPLRRAQARLVVERAIAQRQQVSAGIVVLVRGLGSAEPLLELIHVIQVGAQRLSARRASVELREAATITGKNAGIRVAARGQPQQQLVGVEPREQPLPLERVAQALGLDVREPAEIAASNPRQLERRERLQQRALAPARSARAARDEAHPPVRGRHAFEQLARVAVGSLMQNERALEQHLFALCHYTSNPSRCSSRSLSAQCSRTLTQSSRCTRSPSSSRNSWRASVPACLRTLPALPMTIDFWLSRSSQINAWTSRWPSSFLPRCSTSTVKPYGTSLCTSVMSFSRIVSAILKLKSRSVTMPSGNCFGPTGRCVKICSTRRSRFSPLRAEIGRNAAKGLV